MEFCMFPLLFFFKRFYSKKKLGPAQDLDPEIGGFLNVKVALVTGGNRGIGYELVKQLALKGFKVILTRRNPKKGHEAAQKLKESNLEVLYVIMDVENQESIHQAAMSVNERYGRLDV